MIMVDIRSIYGAEALFICMQKLIIQAKSPITVKFKMGRKSPFLIIEHIQCTQSPNVLIYSKTILYGYSFASLAFVLWHYVLSTHFNTPSTVYKCNFYFFHILIYTKLFYVCSYDPQNSRLYFYVELGISVIRGHVVQ